MKSSISKNIGATLALALALLLTGQVSAAFVYVGSYKVNDGPLWFISNPPVYSAEEAAALIFGGSPSDYAISIDSNTTDPNTITFTGWYDGWGEHSGMEFAQGYKLDLGAPGYDDPQGEGTARSAYVRDGLDDNFVNYVWRRDGVNGVPEGGATLCLLGLVLPGLMLVRRKLA